MEGGSDLENERPNFLSRILTKMRSNQIRVPIIDTLSGPPRFIAVTCILYFILISFYFTIGPESGNFESESLNICDFEVRDPNILYYPPLY